MSPPRNVLGVNINEGASWQAGPAELKATSAQWVRGFFGIPAADRGNVADLAPINMLLELGKQGYGTVLSLKFPYNDAPIPTPGSPAMADAKRRLNAVLPIVMGAVDVLAIGNEPFIECLASDRRSPRLNAFYEAMAQQVIAYREAQGGSTRLYMGALNHLDKPSWQTPATDAWMAYVRSTPAIDGVDIHPHVASLADAQQYLDYVTPRLRSDQTFLATEFSLVQLWQQYMTQPVSAAFTSKYQLPSGVPLWQVLKDALAAPFTQEKWNDLLSDSPWFTAQSSYIQHQMSAFQATGKLAVAHYGVTQDPFAAATFGPTSTPWVLNSIFCPHTVRQMPGGLPGRTTQWFEGFRAASSALA